MRHVADDRLRWAIVLLALLLFVIAGLVGGPGTSPDVRAIMALGAERAAHPGLTSIAILITNVGGADGMISILALVVALLVIKHRWREAMLFAAILLSGRAVVELIKLAIHRPRPSFGPYPVGVSSLSFPSAHSANSMMTFLTIALLFAPPDARRAALLAALALAVTIGATRPFLGVHWPTDVVGGWAFGIAWAVTLSHLARASHYWPASGGSREA